MEFLLKNMSTSKGAEKLKITVTNIRSVLIRKNKRLANLKKINTRDTRKLFSLSKARDAENKFPRETLEYLIRKAEPYASHAAVGGVFNTFSGSITLTDGQQDYDIYTDY